jgi:hypothetical protein
MIDVDVDVDEDVIQFSIAPAGGAAACLHRMGWGLQLLAAHILPEILPDILADILQACNHMVVLMQVAICSLPQTVPMCVAGYNLQQKRVGELFQS